MKQRITLTLMAANIIALYNAIDHLEETPLHDLAPTTPSVPATEQGWQLIHVGKEQEQLSTMPQQLSRHQIDMVIEYTTSQDFIDAVRAARQAVADGETQSLEYVSGNYSFPEFTWTRRQPRSVILEPLTDDQALHLTKDGVLSGCVIMTENEIIYLHETEEFNDKLEQQLLQQSVIDNMNWKMIAVAAEFVFFQVSGKLNTTLNPAPEDSENGVNPPALLLVTDIQWDTEQENSSKPDQDAIGLPDHAFVTLRSDMLEDDERLQDSVNDALSNAYGYTLESWTPAAGLLSKDSALTGALRALHPALPLVLTGEYIEVLDDETRVTGMIPAHEYDEDTLRELTRRYASLTDTYAHLGSLYELLPDAARWEQRVRHLLRVSPADLRVALPTFQISFDDCDETQDGNPVSPSNPALWRVDVQVMSPGQPEEDATSISRCTLLPLDTPQGVKDAYLRELHLRLNLCALEGQNLTRVVEQATWWKATDFTETSFVVKPLKVVMGKGQQHPCRNP